MPVLINSHVVIATGALPDGARLEFEWGPDERAWSRLIRRGLFRRPVRLGAHGVAAFTIPKGWLRPVLVGGSEGKVEIAAIFAAIAD